MRVYLLLILFFASTASSRVRMKRASNMTTIAPSNTSTNNGGNTCTGNGCNHKDFHNLFKMIISKVIKAILLPIKDVLLTILKVINETNRFAVKVTMQPLVYILHLTIKFIKLMANLIEKLFKLE